MPVFDISRLDINSISKEESFVLDTNILVFLHSGFYTNKNNKYISTYSNFISKLLLQGNRLYVTTVAVQEFIHIFERKHYKLYLSVKGLSDDRNNQRFLSLKKYRKLKDERSSVQKSLSQALYEILAQYDFLECSIILSDIKIMLQNYTRHSYDPMDYFVVAESTRKGITNFISDDSDFQYDTSINVYCACH